MEILITQNFVTLPKIIDMKNKITSNISIKGAFLDTL